MDLHPDVVGLKSFPCVRVKRLLLLSVCLVYAVKRPLQFSLGASHTYFTKLLSFKIHG